jgi:hypothetical protein
MKNLIKSCYLIVFQINIADKCIYIKQNKNNFVIFYLYIEDINYDYL